MDIQSDEYIKNLDGVLIERTNWFYQSGDYLTRMFHNETGPAVIEYADGVLSFEAYYVHNKAHRTDGPAKIFYRDRKTMDPTILVYTDIVETENYYVDGYLHRTDGPAVIVYTEDGTIGQCKYFINGKDVTDIVELNKEALNDPKLMKVLS